RRKALLGLAAHRSDRSRLDAVPPLRPSGRVSGARFPRARGGQRSGRALPWVLAVALAPLWLVAGEPLRQVVLRPRVRMRPSPGAALLADLLSHPALLALTAPARFLTSRHGRRRGGRIPPGRGDGPPPPAGDREPRNPPSVPPSDAVSLTP
ncbi:hypothetical protein, partial [Streptacidiphilus monticola]